MTARTIRFLVGDPDSDITRSREEIENVPLPVSNRIAVTLEAPAIEARLADRHIAVSVFIFDDDAIVNIHLADLLGHDSPTLHLRRHGDDGLYDRFTNHVDHIWLTARNLWA